MAGPRKRRSTGKKTAGERPPARKSRGKRSSAGGGADSQQEPLAMPPQPPAHPAGAVPDDAAAGAARKSAARKRGAARKGKGRGAAAAAAESAAAAAEAQFVFRGFLQEAGAATFDEVPLTRETCVVGVEEIIRAPEMLRDFEGSAITVQLGEGVSADVGEHYIFYTNGWIYGSGLAVHAVAVTAPDADAGAAAAVHHDTIPARALAQRTGQADLVVAGQVTQVRQAPKAPSAPITEHDPHWQDAVVTVDSVLQAPATSAAQPEEVVVRFAASRDVRWAAAPKFGVGQAGIWMLGHKDAATSRAARAAADVGDDAYVVTNPNDFHPIEAIDQVQSILAQGRAGDET